MQSRKRSHSDVQSQKRNRSPTITDTPLGMAIRRNNVREMLTNFGFLPPTNPSQLQLRQAFHEYTKKYPEDDNITLEHFNNIASAYHGGKIRHKKHVCSYKKRSTMNKKRAKSMKKK